MNVMWLKTDISYFEDMFRKIKTNYLLHGKFLFRTFGNLSHCSLMVLKKCVLDNYKLSKV